VVQQEQMVLQVMLVTQVQVLYQELVDLLVQVEQMVQQVSLVTVV
jgi:hypothetical protein